MMNNQYFLYFNLIPYHCRLIAIFSPIKQLENSKLQFKCSKKKIYQIKYKH